MSSRKPLIIGLTGGIGSGKTTVAQAFRQLGIDVICADKIAHDLVSKGQSNLEAIKTHFGPDILDNNRNLNRSLLRQRIFDNPAEKKWLEQLLHPQVRSEMAKQIRVSQSPYIILDIPLLLESEPNPLVQRILVVDCTPEQQRERTKRRDHLSDELITKIMTKQVSRAVRLQQADDIIDNSKTLADTQHQVLKLHDLYQSFS